MRRELIAHLRQRVFYSHMQRTTTCFEKSVTTNLLTPVGGEMALAEYRKLPRELFTAAPATIALPLVLATSCKELLYDWSLKVAWASPRSHRDWR